MASNIAVKITADVASLQSQLAIARAEFQQTQRAMNDLARQAATAGLNDKLKSDLQQAAANMLQAKQRTNELASEMRSLSPATSSLHSSFEALNSVIGKFGIVLGVTEGVEFGKVIFENAANLQRQADALGISTDQLQAFQFAARASGVEIETAQAALTKFYSGLGLAYEGTGPALRALQDMGLNIGKLAADQDNASATIARALLAESNQYERNAHIRELFSRGGQDINAMLEQLAQGFDKNLDAAKRQGEYLGEDSTKAALKASIEFEKAKKQLEDGLTPAVTLLTHSLTGLVWMFRDIGSAAPAAGKWILGVGEDALQAIPLIGPLVPILESLVQKKKELAGGKTFEAAVPYRIPKSGEQVDVAGLNALDAKLRERKVLVAEIKTATDTLQEAQAAGDASGVRDARTVIADLQKQLDGLNKQPFGGGFSNAGEKAIAQARETISEINADQTKGDAERRTAIDETYKQLLNSAKLNQAQVLAVETDKNKALTAAARQAATEKRQVDQATAQNEQRIAQVGFDAKRSAIEEEVTAGNLTRQQGFAQLLALTDDETAARLKAVQQAEQGYAADTTFFIQKELEKKLIVAESEAQKAAIRRQAEQASATESAQIWKRSMSEIEGVENTFESQLLSGRVGVLGAMEAAGAQFVQEEIKQTIKGLTERLLLSKSELAADQSLGQLGVLSHWLFEGQKTAATGAGEATREGARTAAGAAENASFLVRVGRWVASELGMTTATTAAETARAAAAATSAASTAGAQTAAKLAEATLNSTSAESYAAVAATGAAASQAFIPIIGPELAITAAATTFGAMQPFVGLASLDTGTNYVPRDMPAMIHAGERVVPAADNSAMVAALQGGAANGNGGQVQFHYHAPAGRQTDHAQDAKDMVRMFNHARRTGALKLK